MKLNKEQIQLLYFPIDEHQEDKFYIKLLPNEDVSLKNTSKAMLDTKIIEKKKAGSFYSERKHQKTSGFLSSKFYCKV